MDSHPPLTRLSRRAALIGAAQAVALLAAACVAVPMPPNSTATPPDGPVLLPTEGPGCAERLAPVVAPTPIPYPGYVQMEPSTGLHVTAPPQVLDPATYRLSITGKVAHTLSLTLDELRCLPKIKQYCQIACPGFFVDWSNLAGAALASVLDLAGPLEGARDVNFAGVDERRSAVSLAQVAEGGYFLAYEWEGQLLPASHGFPIRVALPDQVGGGWVKWLTEISIT